MGSDVVRLSSQSAEGTPVERINYALDIQPLSTFRKQASALIDRLQKSRRPLVLTRNGRSAVVVVDATTVVTVFSAAVAPVVAVMFGGG